MMYAFATEPGLLECRDKFIGADLFTFHCTLDRVAQWLLPSDFVFDSPLPQLEFSEEQFRSRMLDLQRLLDAQEIGIEYWTPLWNLVAERPFELSDGVRVDVMSDWALKHALQTATITGDQPSGRRFRQLPQNRWGLHHVYSAPKLVTGILQPNVSADAAAAAQDAERMLDVVSLTDSGQIAVGGTMSHSTFGAPIGFEAVFFGGWATAGLNIRPMTRTPVTVDADKAARMREAWGLFEQQPSEGPISLAMRRLRFALMRDREEDRILDQAIAAEGLLLPGSDDEREIKFRTSLHAAYYIGETPDDRQRIYQVVGKAYNARSIVAHGGNLREWAQAQRIDLAQLVGDFHIVVRECVRKRLTEPNANVDWLQLLVGP